MAKEQLWILLRRDGSVAAQVIIAGKATPAEAGDNPAGLVEVKVKRHGDLIHERWIPKRGWVSDKAKKARAERRHELRTMAREDVVEMLLGKIDEVNARVAALEAKAAG